MSGVRRLTEHIVGGTAHFGDIGEGFLLGDPVEEARLAAAPVRDADGVLGEELALGSTAGRGDADNALVGLAAAAHPLHHHLVLIAVQELVGHSDAGFEDIAPVDACLKVCQL